MNIVVFDTETINTEKPFCYNIGYCIYNTEIEQIIAKKEFVVEQIWHNTALFSTAYFAGKRPLYVSRMRAKKIKMAKYGFICQEMIRDFKNYQVEIAFAYNSQFDEKVFNFNCDYFKTQNPFDNIPIKDIMPFVHNKIAFTKKFKDFCEQNERFTETGNYSTTAETVMQYISDNENFIEEHTALSDSEIELKILTHCINLGCEWNGEYKRYKTIPRKTKRILKIRVKDNENPKEEYITEFEFTSMRINKNRDNIILRNE